LRPSHEVDKEQLRLAREEGDSYQKELDYMIEEVVHTGAIEEVGDYVVAIAQEEAEGLYHPTEDGIEWQNPEEGMNAHLEVVVCDREDGRFIPNLDVTATITPEEKDEGLTFRVPFIWHPGLFHYGRNIELSGDGVYNVKVRVQPPDFHRHDKVNGDRYTETVEVEFEGIEIETGREEL